jgi:hypothetical protein
MNEGGSAVVRSLERAGSRISDDGENGTKIVEEAVEIDRGMGLTVDGIAQMSGAAHGTCCLLPCRG